VREKYCWLVADKPSEQAVPWVDYKLAAQGTNDRLLVVVIYIQEIFASTTNPTIANNID
jgi:hypothetical protein